MNANNDIIRITVEREHAEQRMEASAMTTTRQLDALHCDAGDWLTQVVTDLQSELDAKAKSLSLVGLAGLRFWSQTRKQNMILVTEGPHKDWICYQHPDGQWVTLRKATPADLEALAPLMAATAL
jgi:hypothetical protein